MSYENVHRQGRSMGLVGNEGQDGVNWNLGGGVEGVAACFRMLKIWSLDNFLLSLQSEPF